MQRIAAVCIANDGSGQFVHQHYLLKLCVKFILAALRCHQSVLKSGDQGTRAFIGWNEPEVTRSRPVWTQAQQICLCWEWILVPCRQREAHTHHCTFSPGKKLKWENKWQKYIAHELQFKVESGLKKKRLNWDVKIMLWEWFFLCVAKNAVQITRECGLVNRYRELPKDICRFFSSFARSLISERRPLKRRKTAICQNQRGCFSQVLTSARWI